MESTNNVINELKEKVIGLSEKEASELCEKHNVRCRSIRDGDTHYIITMDLNPNRLNFEIDNDVVTKCELF